MSGGLRLETVVLRENGSKVMILKGSHNNEADIFLQRDSQCQEVQLLDDRDEIATYHYHICVFAGEMQHRL